VLLKTTLAGTEVMQAQVNRVPETNSPDFVLMTPLETSRLGTNYDTDLDCLFTASMAGTVMTVTEIDPVVGSPIQNNVTVYGEDVADNTVIVSQLSGPTGGIGTYEISVSQTVNSSPMAAGTETLLQPTGLAIQLDVHGPNSWNNANIITTIFRDEKGVLLFLEQGLVVVPLYCDDPRQTPFINEQDQIEDRFVITARFEADQKVTVSQQFTQEPVVTPKGVLTLFPLT
jgi:hypothetical protein